MVDVFSIKRGSAVEATRDERVDVVVVTIVVVVVVADVVGIVVVVTVVIEVDVVNWKRESVITDKDSKEGISRKNKITSV